MKLTVILVNVITPISALLSTCKMVKGIFREFGMDMYTRFDLKSIIGKGLL